ncbi:MAG: hypothetical protein NUV64_00835 [Parcubacteria group bacterium]|nr:hypothetical protein [Parcubacteria group bacterium]MCR4342658.1 hypothetical protein [Patescibacteria group bacterium]
MDNKIFSKLAKIFLVLSLFSFAFIVKAELSPSSATLSAEVNAVKTIDGSQNITSESIRELEEKRAELKKELEKRQIETQQNILEKKREIEKARIEARSINGEIDGKDNLRINANNKAGGLKEVAVQIRKLNKEEIRMFEGKREELKNEIERKREEYKKEIENKREEAKKEIEQKREELKARLLNIKDERKKNAIEKIDGQIKKLNERMIEHFSNVLDKMEDVLKGISSRADKAEAHGLDVSSVRVLIVNAETAIDSARVSVAEQAGKVYSIDITTEDKLKFDVSETRKLLHGDLEIVKEAVKNAHTAIREAAVGLAHIPKVDEYEVEEDDSQDDNNATTSDNSSNN